MIDLALRNIFRHRIRTGITLAAIVFGVVALVLSGGFVHDMFFRLGETIIHSQTGHMQVAKKGFFSYGSRSPERYTIDSPGGTQDAPVAAGEVSDVLGRVQFSGLLNNGRTDLAIVGEGIEPEKEAKLGSYLVMTRGPATHGQGSFRHPRRAGRRRGAQARTR